MFGKSPLLCFQLANNIRTKDDIITKALAGIVGFFQNFRLRLVIPISIDFARCVYEF